MADLSRLGEGEVSRDDTDFGANDVLTLSEAFEQEDSAGDMNTDAITLPVLCVNLFAVETEMAALIDVPEHAEAEFDGMKDGGVEGTESVFGLLQGDGACHFTGYAFRVGGRVKVGFGLKGEAEATVCFAVGREDEAGGK